MDKITLNIGDEIYVNGKWFWDVVNITPEFITVKMYYTKEYPGLATPNSTKIKIPADSITAHSENNGIKYCLIGETLLKKLTGGLFKSLKVQSDISDILESVNKDDENKLKEIAYQLQQLDFSKTNNSIKLQKEYKKLFQKIYGHTSYIDPFDVNTRDIAKKNEGPVKVGDFVLSDSNELWKIKELDKGYFVVVNKKGDEMSIPFAFKDYKHFVKVSDVELKYDFKDETFENKTTIQNTMLHTSLKNFKKVINEEGGAYATCAGTPGMGAMADLGGGTFSDTAVKLQNTPAIPTATPSFIKKRKKKDVSKTGNVIKESTTDDFKSKLFAFIEYPWQEDIEIDVIKLLSQYKDKFVSKNVEQIQAYLRNLMTTNDFDSKVFIQSSDSFADEYKDLAGVESETENSVITENIDYSNVQFDIKKLFRKYDNELPEEICNKKGLLESLELIEGNGEIEKKGVDDGEKLMYKEMLDNDNLILVIHAELDRSPYGGALGYEYEIGLYKNNPQSYQIGGGYGTSGIVGIKHTALLNYSDYDIVHYNKTILSKVIEFLKKKLSDPQFSANNKEYKNGDKVYTKITMQVPRSMNSYTRWGTLVNIDGDKYILKMNDTGKEEAFKKDSLQ